MDWSEEHRYKVLIADPDVRRRIQAAAAGARAPLSGEDSLILMAARGFHSRRKARRFVLSVESGHRAGLALRLRVTRKRRAKGHQPVGKAIVAVLCSMARNSQKVQAVEQRDDGCEITAEIPSDQRAWTGVLQVTISREPAGGSVIAATAKSLGQVFDYGKARKTVRTLFADVQEFSMPWGSTVGPL